jgi:putative component of membrane protein insertase Oxa1/YidC/SpoIIIJ protein YidD
VARNLFFLLGPLLLVPAAAVPSTDLAAELFAEGRWQECSRECARARLAEPALYAPRVLGAIAQLRLHPGHGAALRELEALAGAVTNDLAALAAFEAGRARWLQGAVTNAFRGTRTAFRLAVQSELSARSGCLLSEILRQFPNLGKNDAALFQTLETCRPLWTPEVIRDALGAPPAAGSLSVRWIVALYRAQISPALGARCSLTPSCSEYFRQAGRTHGLLAFPLVADRLVREPGVVQAAEHPVQAGEHVRYTDPLAEHDYWLRSKGNK